MTFCAVVWTCICVGLPLLLAAEARRRFGCGWRCFALGAFVSALTHLLFSMVRPQTMLHVLLALTSPWHLSYRSEHVAWGVLLALLVAAVREVCRCLGYRTLMRRADRTWANGVVYGLGSGWLMLMLSVHPGRLGPWLTGDAHATGRTVLGLWSAAWGLPVEVALSVLVLQVFRQGRFRWLVIAIVAHTLRESTLLLIRQTVSPSAWPAAFWPQVLLSASLGAGSLYLIAAMRDPAEGENALAPAESMTVSAT